MYVSTEKTKHTSSKLPSKSKIFTCSKRSDQLLYIDREPNTCVIIVIMLIESLSGNNSMQVRYHYHWRRIILRSYFYSFIFQKGTGSVFPNLERHRTITEPSKYLIFKRVFLERMSSAQSVADCPQRKKPSEMK